MHLFNLFGGPKPPTPAKAAAFRPTLESLEDRTVPAGDMILRWNAVALKAVILDHSVGTPMQGGPTAGARALGIVHAAMYDAFNCVEKIGTPFLVHRAALPGTDVDAAVAKAAHTTLVALYPNQKAHLDAALFRSIGGSLDSTGEMFGFMLGRSVGRLCMRSRQNDGAEVMTQYTFQNGAGQHQKDPLHLKQGTLGAGWGNVRPFLMPTAAMVHQPAPPALNSPEYTASYNEVFNLGGDGVTTPTQRTAEQTQIGIFWGYDGTPGLGVPPVLYNEIVRTIAKKMHNTEAENARLFALVNLGMADAGIACWDDKYLYNFWRPVIGIQNGDADGNPDTVGDADWLPYGAPASNGAGTNFTPPFPAYPSGHATFGGVVFETLRNFYHRDQFTFTIGSDEFNGRTIDQNGQVRPVVKRTYHSFSQAEEENGQSRIYLGIHWSFDKQNGIAMGRQIADYIFAHALRPK